MPVAVRVAIVPMQVTVAHAAAMHVAVVTVVPMAVMVMAVMPVAVMPMTVMAMAVMAAVVTFVRKGIARRSEQQRCSSGRDQRSATYQGQQASHVSTP